jgi:hypothetical protein
VGAQGGGGRLVGGEEGLTFGPDAHNDRVRFTWALLGPDGAVGGGTDFAIVAPDGRLRSVTGFSEPAA